MKRIHYAAGPVSLEADADGNLPRIGKAIVTMMGMDRDARMLARLEPRDPAWNDSQCTPDIDCESTIVVAPELRVHDRSVTLVGEIGGGRVLTSVEYDMPDIDIEAEIQKILSRIKGGAAS